MAEDVDASWSRARFRHMLAIPTRWQDQDAYGHVNNVVYYSLFDTAVNTHLVTEGGLDILEPRHRGRRLCAQHVRCSKLTKLFRGQDHVEVLAPQVAMTTAISCEYLYTLRSSSGTTERRLRSRRTHPPAGFLSGDGER